MLFEYEAASVTQALFAGKGIPRALTADDFSPTVMQRAIPGQAGCQFFFNEGGRAFCLYAVIGSYAQRATLVGQVNAVLATVQFSPSWPARPGDGTHDDHIAVAFDDHDRPAGVDSPGCAHDDDAMSVLAGPFVIASALVVLGGVFKAIDPADTAYALRALGLPHAALLVRAGGAAEVLIGLGALVVGGPVFATLVALAYLAFAAFVVVALRSGSPISSCGCFGKVDTPPSSVHVVIDLLAAGRRGHGRVRR